MPTTMRGGLEPMRCERPRYSHAAMAATIAVAATNRDCQCAGRNTSTNTMGIRTRAVRTRFIFSVEDTAQGRHGRESALVVYDRYGSVVSPPRMESGRRARGLSLTFKTECQTICL